MKYSIVMPYYKRGMHLNNTFVSFVHHYHNRNDYEVIIIEDIKNREDSIEHIKLLDTINKFKDDINIVYLSTNFTDCFNPCLNFNYGIEKALGEFILITNPECMHKVDILAGLDHEYAINPKTYIICACEAIYCDEEIDNMNELKFTHFAWFQHSEFNNCRLHFCSSISKDNFDMIGGFDEEYSHGIAYEDTDFLRLVMNNNIPIICRDDLLILHIEHDRGYASEELIEKNKNYYLSKS